MFNVWAFMVCCGRTLPLYLLQVSVQFETWTRHVGERSGDHLSLSYKGHPLQAPFYCVKEMNSFSGL